MGVACQLFTLDIPLQFVKVNSNPKKFKKNFASFEVKCKRKIPLLWLTAWHHSWSLSTPSYPSSCSHACSNNRFGTSLESTFYLGFSSSTIDFIHNSTIFSFFQWYLIYIYFSRVETNITDIHMSLFIWWYIGYKYI